MNRSYTGPPLDLRWQYIGERPEVQDDDPRLEGEEELVYATDPEPPGEERTENVPIPGPTQPDVEGQSTLEDWRAVTTHVAVRYVCPDCRHPTMQDDPDSIGYLCGRCEARARDEPTRWQPRGMDP